MVRRRTARRKVDALTHGQLLELMLGPRGVTGLEHFRDDGHAEDVYLAHRDQLFELLGGDVTQSWAFKKFETRRLAGATPKS